MIQFNCVFLRFLIKIIKYSMDFKGQKNPIKRHFLCRKKGLKSVKYQHYTRKYVDIIPTKRIKKTFEITLFNDYFRQFG
jgi:capsid portal protein